MEFKQSLASQGQGQGGLPEITLNGTYDNPSFSVEVPVSLAGVHPPVGRARSAKKDGGSAEWLTRVGFILLREPT